MRAARRRRRKDRREEPEARAWLPPERLMRWIHCLRCTRRRISVLPGDSVCKPIAKPCVRNFGRFSPANSRSSSEIAVLELHVVLRRVVKLFDLLGGELACAPRGIADPELAFADDLAGRDHRARGDEAV